MSNPFAGMEIPSPAFELGEVGALLADRYGLVGPLRSLGSHQDQNVMVQAPSGCFILKISNPGFSHDGLVAQNEAMQYLAAHAAPFRAPVPLPDAAGNLIGTAAKGGVDYDIRLVTFLDGQPLASFGYLAPRVLRRHGWLAASAALALADFDHPGLDRVLQWDVRRSQHVVDAFAPSIPDEAGRAEVQRATERAQRRIDELAEHLRVGVCHADVTDVNVVARRNSAGQPWPDALIDFGDMLRTWIAADVAVATVSLVGHDPADALSVTAEVLRGYHEVLPLGEHEVAALWPLVVARAGSNVASSEHQARLEPDDAYVKTSVEDDWLIWNAVRDIPWRAAHGVLAEAVGMSAPQPPTPPPVSVPLVALPPGTPTVDQAVDADTFDPEAWNLTHGIHSQLEAGWGVGRYGEGRLALTGDGGVSTGADIFAPAGTPVTAPMDAPATWSHDGDGCTVTLALDEVWRLVVGPLTTTERHTMVRGGESLGVIGGDAAGLRVSLVADHDHLPPFLSPRAAGWRHATTDPVAWGAVAPIPAGLPDGPGDASSWLQRRDRVLAKAQEHYYEQPPRIERGRRHHLYDTDGRRYLDMVNNVAILGHSHPGVAAAVNRSLHLLNTNSRFHYAVMVEFAERLAALLPAPLDTVFLVSTGSEANEVALRLIRAATGSRDVIAVRSAYHGWTTGTDEISTSLADNPHAATSRPPWVHVVESPNQYRGPFAGDGAAAAYAADVDRAIGEIAVRGGRLGGFIAEPVYGNAGGLLLPDGYLQQVYTSVRAAGGLCVADEVQVGYGRLGDYFWGFEQQGVVPDIVTMAKCTGNGVPVGAVVTTREIADHLRVEGSFFSSMGGSPLGCAAGLATLAAIEHEGLQANARRVGDHIASQVLALEDPLIGAVHGLGLYRGIELVRDRQTLEPATDEALAVCERLRELGIIVQPTSDAMNVLKIKPPLCIDLDAADTFVSALATALDDGW